ncbi:hypothetical protein C1T17_17390 [Sphingobium sp. SCG-1]|uniref:VOC family protein n=1 Tax=Sphingobium sp. SCG-1 TaxID=2072936 RepID=UPI000CD68ACD|nr:VOC family protein [Sphingobium sp. SCG-1]AUW59588.1 hypothetical protein C1T17_17390 [Sphingobium sp. SCG-1]
MIDLQRIHHTGVAVADIEQAQIHFGKALGLKWAPVRRFDPLPFWTPEQGTHEVHVKATYSLGGPNHLELVQGTGPFYDPGRLPDARHIGVWVDDLAAEAQHLLDQGWQVVASGAAPEKGFGLIAYMALPTPGLLVELISADLKPVIDDWLGE